MRKLGFDLVAAATACALLAFASPAAAQQPPPPQGGTLPPLPGEQPTQPAPGQPPPAAQQTAPPPGYAQQPPPVYYQQPPPPPPPEIEYTPPPEPTHAPKFSLYAGASLRYMGFGGYFYQNQDLPTSPGEGETTGNFAGNGPAIELDVGARLAKRYIPFLLFEHGFMAQGHRFTGSDATTSSDLLGVGLRMVSGDVDSAGFLGEISVGVRSITVKGNGQEYKMSALEIFRLGLGAEIRLATLFSLSPMAHISGGVMNDTDGTIAFSPDGSRDGRTAPTYTQGQNIQNQRGYVMVAIGCGGHFDIFGK
jgi:hypothetical protein